jgi:hypothetical protein
MADDADRLAFMDLQIDAMQHRDTAVACAQIGDFEHHIGALKMVCVGVV